MPCNSDYLNATSREQELQKAAILYRYVLEKVGLGVPQEIIEASNSPYSRASIGIIDCAPRLCALLTSWGEEERDTFFRENMGEKKCRMLMDWWEEHEEADRAREEKEEEEWRVEKEEGIKVLTSLLRKILSKLSNEDLETLRHLAKKGQSL